MASRILTGLLFTLVAACSKKEAEKVKLFYGACQLEVKSSVKDSEILIDGVEVGEEGHAKENLPCGWRQIRVEAHGYEAVKEYHELTAASPASLTIKLEKSKKPQNYALSSQLIKDIRAGKFSEQPKEQSEAPAQESAPAAESPVTEKK